MQDQRGFVLLHPCEKLRLADIIELDQTLHRQANRLDQVRRRLGWIEILDHTERVGAVGADILVERNFQLNL